MYDNKQTTNFDDAIFADESINSEPNYGYLQPSFDLRPGQIRIADNDVLNRFPEPKIEQDIHFRKNDDTSIFDQILFKSNNNIGQNEGKLRHAYHSQIKFGPSNLEKFDKGSSKIGRSRSHVVMPSGGRRESDYRVVRRRKKVKKSNCKNVFIQRIQELLRDSELRKNISVEDPDLDQLIKESRGLIKVPNFYMDNDEESKSKLKLTNKESAKNSRTRKKLYISLLEAKISLMTRKNEELKNNMLLSHQNLSSLNPYNTSSQSTTESSGFFKELLEQVIKSDSPSSVLSFWDEYKNKCFRLMPSFYSEFTQFINNSITNYNKIGYTPLLRFFLNMHSSQAKKFLDKLTPEEKKVFKEIIGIYREKNKHEIQTVEKIKGEMKVFFEESMNDEIKINKMMKKIRREKIFDILNKIAKNHPDFKDEDEDHLKPLLGKRDHSSQEPMFSLEPKMEENRYDTAKRITVEHEEYLDDL